MLNVLQRILFWGERLQIIAGVLILTTIVVTVTAGIFSRYVFNSPFPWTEELATFLFIWLSFLGAGVAAARRKHVVVDFWSQKIKGVRAGLVKMFISTMVMVFLALTAYGAILLQPKTSTHASVALNIPKNYYYLPVLVIAIYMLLVYLVEFILAARELKKS